MIPRNVTEAVEPPRPSAKEIRPLGVEQVKKLLAAAKGDKLEALYVLAENGYQPTQSHEARCHAGFLLVPIPCWSFMKTGDGELPMKRFPKSLDRFEYFNPHEAALSVAKPA